MSVGTMTDSGGYGADLRVVANPQNGRPTSLTHSAEEAGDPSYDNSIIHKVSPVVRLDLSSKTTTRQEADELSFLTGLLLMST